MSMHEENLLPVGSVVSLKPNNKYFVIIGYKKNEIDKNYDYIGCVYPVGAISEDFILVFKKENIDKLIFNGYIDNEEIKKEIYGDIGVES